MTISQILGCPSPTNTRRKHDAYQTPPAVTRALARVEFARWPSRIWEPCTGAGKLAAVLREFGTKVIESDLPTDFLKTTRAAATAIVTNPPYRLATEFIMHAHELGVAYHAWLLKADFLNAQRAQPLIETVGYPARIWVLTERPDFLAQGAPTMNCSWFVFAGRHSKASLQLLPMRGDKAPTCARPSH
jgi:hypothetical protein